MARELELVVIVDGTVYGPGYLNPPPDDVAKTITNPAAWGEESEDNSDGSPQGDEPVEAPVVASPGDGDVTSPDTPEPITPSEPPKPTIPEPPRSGAGSGIGAWRTFADANDVDYGADDSRDEIIDACKKAKVI
jgi:hypothetical protein